MLPPEIKMFIATTLEPPKEKQAESISSVFSFMGTVQRTDLLNKVKILARLFKIDDLSWLPFGLCLFPQILIWNYLKRSESPSPQGRSRSDGLWLSGNSEAVLGFHLQAGTEVFEQFLSLCFLSHDLELIYSWFYSDLLILSWLLYLYVLYWGQRPHISTLALTDPRSICFFRSLRIPATSYGSFPCCL